MSRPVGLSSERLGFGPATMQVVVHDHVAVSTPSRPGRWRRTALHLLEPPADPVAALDRFAATLGHLPGLVRDVVAWETEGDEPGVEVPPGLAVEPAEVRVLAADATLPARPVPDGVSIVRASTPEHWAGAKVLYLQTDWEGDEAAWRWQVEQQRRTAEEGRGLTLVAYQLGIPVGRATMAAAGPSTPRIDQGLAVVEDVVVHPLYRRRGIGAALVWACADLTRRLDPRFPLVGRVPPGTPVAAAGGRLGFAPRGRTWTAVRPR